MMCTVKVNNVGLFVMKYRVLQGQCFFVGQPEGEHHSGSLDKKPLPVCCYTFGLYRK